MKSSLAVFLLIVGIVLSQGCATTISLTNPLDVARGAHCPSAARASLGEVVACRPVWVSQDTWRPGLQGGAFATALEEAGVNVLRSRPWEKDVDFLELRVMAGGNGYGETLRARIEVRNPVGDLLYFNERVAVSQLTLGRTMASMSSSLCVVRPWPCGPSTQPVEHEEISNHAHSAVFP